MRIYLLTSKQLLNHLNQRSIQQNLKSSIYLNYFKSNARFLSTSKILLAHDPLPPIDPKKYGGDGHTYLDPDVRLRPPAPKSIEDFANPEKTGHWYSYGFDEVDIKADRYWMKMVMFVMCCLFLPTLVMWWYYEPDNIRGIYEWKRREAHLELCRRQKYGLPIIDPDYIPREKMLQQLPAEEDIDIEVHY